MKSGQPIRLAEDGVVVLASQGVALAGNVRDGLVSLAVGLIGVALARWVFVNKEQRKSGNKEQWHDWLPLTLVAMLITAVIVWDRQLSVSAAAFTGLGAGWAAVILLEVLGERLTGAIKAMLGTHPAQHPPPVHHPVLTQAQLDRLDLSGNRGRLTDKDREIPDDMQTTLDLMDMENKPKE